MNDISYIKLIDLFESTLLKSKSSNETALNFFRRNNIGMSIYYIIMKSYYLKHECNLNYIFKNMSIGSRQTIRNLINEAILSEFLIKFQNKLDKRKYDIKPSTLMIDEFENYIGDLKNIIIKNNYSFSPILLLQKHYKLLS